MLTLVCSVIAAAIAYGIFWQTGFTAENQTWAIVISAAIILGCQIISMLILRKISIKNNQVLQGIMEETQKRIMQKQQQFMRRPLSQKQMITELEKEQAAGIDRMLEALKIFEPLYKWNFMIKKQVNTMKMMFSYQKKDFKTVDAIMDQCMLFDAQSCAMKMARMYVNKEDDKALDKFYKRKCLRFKGVEGALITSTYAWILVKRERIDMAIQALAEAKARTSDNPVIVKNWEMLVNGKVAHFSNSGLGETWFALHLEAPKMQKVQQQQQVRYR